MAANDEENVVKGISETIGKPMGNKCCQPIHVLQCRNTCNTKRSRSTAVECNMQTRQMPKCIHTIRKEGRRY